MFELELHDSGFVGRNRCALDAYVVFLDGLCGVNRDFIVGLAVMGSKREKIIQWILRLVSDAGDEASGWLIVVTLSRLSMPKS